MKINTKIKTIFIAFIIICNAAASEMMNVVVTGVLDGDTVIVQNMKQRVRLANIDAPEQAHGYGKPGQPYSQASTKRLEALLAGGSVRMACYDEDRYQRAICEFFVGSVNINKQMVADGFAWANTSGNGRYLRDKSYLSAQAAAQSARRGLWNQPAAIEPWNWRSDCWKNKVCQY